MKQQKNTFYLIAGPIAAGKSTFMENKLYNKELTNVNLFDHDREKWMIDFYAPDFKNSIGEFAISKAFENSINDSLRNHKDYVMQVHFTNKQLTEINTYFHKYGAKFNMEAHFISVNNLDILKERARRRKKLGGHFSTEKNIESTYIQSFRNFIKYLPKLQKATVWDNSKEYGFEDMEPQIVFERGVLVFSNQNMTDHAKDLLSKVIVSQKKSNGIGR